MTKSRISTAKFDRLQDKNTTSSLTLKKLINFQKKKKLENASLSF